MKKRNRVKDGRKICPKCEQEFPVEHFGFRSCGKVISYCPDCKKASRKEWDEKNRTYEFNRNSNLKRCFGITLEDYDKMFEEQKGFCKICSKTQRKPLVVDHCHTTGVIRGLLCNHCNTGLGMFFDNTQYLTDAIKYLKEATCRLSRKV